MKFQGLKKKERKNEYLIIPLDTKIHAFFLPNVTLEFNATIEELFNGTAVSIARSFPQKSRRLGCA